MDRQSHISSLLQIYQILNPTPEACLLIMEASLKELKIIPRFEYFGIDVKVFNLEHVVGDEHCFYHSISKSPYVSVDHMVDFVEAEMAKLSNIQNYIKHVAVITI